MSHSHAPFPRRWTRRLALAATLGLGGLSSLLAGCASHLGRPEGSPITPPPPVAFSVQADVVYTPQAWPEVLKADLFIPQTPGARPAVLLIHGGGWRPPDRREQMRSIAERLAARGYVVMNATYRLAPAHRHPAALEDLRQALVWLRQESSRLGVDPRRIAAFGYSAGGHLAALLGAVEAPEGQRVQAVVAGGAPSDLRKWPDAPLVVNYLGGPLAELPGLYAEASPVVHISPNDPPVFLYHGGFDLLVPTDHATDYQTALERAGVRNELYIQRGMGHITAFLTDGGAVKAALEFLDRSLAPGAN